MNHPIAGPSNSESNNGSILQSQLGTHTSENSEPNQQQNPTNAEPNNVSILQSQLGTHTLENVVLQPMNPIAGQQQHDTIDMDTNERSPTIPSPETEALLAQITTNNMQIPPVTTTTPTTEIRSMNTNTVSSATTRGTVTTSTTSTTQNADVHQLNAHSSQRATIANRYTIAQLDLVGEIFDKIARLPKIPNIAKPEDFRSLRDAITGIMKAAQRAHIDQSFIEPLLITRAQDALNLYNMAFRFQFQGSGLTYDDLREFLFTNEEHLNNGVNICSRFARSQTVQRTTVQQTAVRNAAANLACSTSTVSRRSVS